MIWNCLNFTGHSPGFSFPFKCPAEHLNERGYDNQIGRWIRIDKLSEKYNNTSPYVYAINNPIKFIGLDGNEIGNPNDPGTKRLQHAMNKTEVGKLLWSAMDGSSTEKFYFHIENSKSRSKFTKTMKPGAYAETTTLSDYNSRSKTGKADDDSKKFKFDPETGKNMKTSEWDNVAIVIK